MDLSAGTISCALVRVVCWEVARTDRVRAIVACRREAIALSQGLEPYRRDVWIHEGRPQQDIPQCVENRAVREITEAKSDKRYSKREGDAEGELCDDADDTKAAKMQTGHSCKQPTERKERIAEE